MCHAVQQLAEFLPELGFKAIREILEKIGESGSGNLETFGNI